MSDSTQLDSKGRLKHLLGIEGLDKSLLLEILKRAHGFIDKKGVLLRSPCLQDKFLLNLFLEPSTRTRCSFELACRRLSGDVLNFDFGLSAVTKGESLLDTVHNLTAMQIDLLVLRHAEEGMAQKVALAVPKGVAVINAGDGCNEHPTQALLDMLMIQQEKPDFSSLCVVIMGDVLHSRVARSEIYALKTLEVREIRVIAPEVLVPPYLAELGVSVFDDVEVGLQGVDVINVLRLQRERMHGDFLEDDAAYFARFGLTAERLAYAKPDAIVMHPGPINRNVEIASDVADGPQSVILRQVTCGVAVRMAVMAMLMAR